MDKKLIDLLVDRFLACPLPEGTKPDPCALNPHHPHRTGTNLLTAAEARQMLEHTLGVMTPAAQDVFAERLRQITEEGWTTHHDDEHLTGGLAQAASCYAEAAGWQARHKACGEGPYPQPCMARWPWGLNWWKPSVDPRRNLVKAGALILAEIERLDRASCKDPNA